MSDYQAERDEIARTSRGTEERFRIAQVAGGIGWFEWDLATEYMGVDAARCRPVWFRP